MSDEKYLQLAEPTKIILKDYAAETQAQRLVALGPIQDLNILVGSTNSGKSRLLRCIMNSKTFTLFNDKGIVENLSILRMLCETIVIDVQKKRFHGTSIRFQNTYQRTIPNETMTYDIYSCVQRAELERSPVNFDAQFFTMLLTAVKELLENGKQAEKISVGNISIDIFSMLKQSNASMHLLLMAFSTVDLRSFIHVGLNYDTPEATLIKERITPISKALHDLLERMNHPWYALVSTAKRIYIPVLRTAISLKHKQIPIYQDELFAENIRENYKIEKEVSIATGLELYQKILTSRADELETRKQLETFCQFLSDTFFNGQVVEIVSIHESHKKGQRINFRVSEIERPLHALGDGIQALIIIMYQLFMAEPGSWIFIEEPEINLHPGLQRIMIDTILNHTVLRKKGLTIFMTSHSNHLIDISIPEYTRVAVFSLERFLTDKEQFVVRSVSNKRMHALNTLGATNSSVLMANCSIWVEGITDRQYLRIYLKAFWKSEEFKTSETYREDIHFAFFEYAGSNLEHYIFVNEDSALLPIKEEAIRGQFIANRVFLIADRDNGKHKKHTKWEGQNYADFTYYVTPGKEIENMISDEILKDLLKAGFVESIVPEAMEKHKCEYSEYQTIGLGKYLVETFKAAETVQEKSGTLNQHYKGKLAKEVSQYIEDLLADKDNAHLAWKKLSEDARKMTKAVHNFIAKHNSGNSVDDA